MEAASSSRERASSTIARRAARSSGSRSSGVCGRSRKSAAVSSSPSTVRSKYTPRPENVIVASQNPGEDGSIVPRSGWMTLSMSAPECPRSAALPPLNLVAGWRPGIEVGLALRLNAFRDVEAPDVYGALATFYEKRGAVLVSERDGRRSHDLRERRGRWCVLEWDAGWEWKVRREAQLHVSRQLGVAGLLVFVYDGDYWGYELFDRGEAKDHFVQTTMDPMI